MERMPQNVEYDGVNLARVAPAAWIVAASLGAVAHHMTALGMHLGHTKLQTVILVTIFIGVLAMLGTGQAMYRMRDTGRIGAMYALAAATLLCSAAVALHGFSSFITMR